MGSEQRLSKARLSLAAALVTMFVWGVNFAFVKHVLEHIGVEALMFVRFSVLPLLGFLLLLLIFPRRIQQNWPRRQDLHRLIHAGLIGHAAHIGVVMYGMNLSTPFSSSLVLTSGPLFTLIILAILGGERPRGRPVAGTLVALAGIVVFLSDKFAAGFSRAGAGDLVLLLAAALFALYTVLGPPLAKRHGPRRRALRPRAGGGAAAGEALRAAHRAVLHAAFLGAANPRVDRARVPRHAGE